MTVAKLESYAEERLFDKDAPTRGVIFSLSNNAKDWTDNRENTVKVEKDGAAELAAGLLCGEGSGDGDLSGLRNEIEPRRKSRKC